MQKSRGDHVTAMQASCEYQKDPRGDHMTIIQE